MSSELKMMEETEPVTAAPASAMAQRVASAADRFLTRLDRMSALLERLELDDRRLQPLHRRALTREFMLSAREVHAELDQFSGWLEEGTQATSMT